MVPLQLSNNQMASSGNQGSVTVVSGGVDNLRTMLEYARTTPETGGYGLTTNTGGISRMVNSNFTASLGPIGSVSFGFLPLVAIGGAIFLWIRSRR